MSILYPMDDGMLFLGQVEAPGMWDQRYKAHEFFYGTEANDFLIAEAHRFAPGGKILCLAEGEGRNAVWLAQQGLQVTGVDSSAVGLAKAQDLATERGVSLTTEVADLLAYDMGVAQWDGIVSIWCHLLQEERGPFHQRMVESLKPGGILLLEAYTPKQLEYKTGGPPVVERMMSSVALAEELVGLTLLVNQEIERDIQEGRGHSGKSAVVQVIGQRPS